MKQRTTGEHLEALDLARDGLWDEAHRLIQNYSDELACLIHAYLHREEGDLGNANYWYRRVGIDTPNESPEDELARLYRLAQEKR